MKHVFIINSHTTFMTAMGVINLNKISYSDIILIYTRNYKNSLLSFNCKIVDFTAECEYCNQNIFKTRKTRNECISLVDKCIEYNIRESFELYFPHLQLIICQLFYTHSFCVNGSYIQEGGYPQSKKFISTFSLKDRIINFIANKIIRPNKRVVRSIGWYQPNYLLKQDVINSYALNDTFFLYLNSVNHIIKWPQYDIDFPIEQNSIIFIFDGFVNNGIVEYDFYMEACSMIINKYACDVNYLKFHPAQKVDERMQIRNMYKDYQKVEDLSDDIPFEAIISSCGKLNIVGFSSSLLKFASDCGHNVIVNDNLLIESPMYRNHIHTSGFPYMWELVKQNGCL